jgi:hypothetical protein
MEQVGAPGVVGVVGVVGVELESSPLSLLHPIVNTVIRNNERKTKNILYLFILHLLSYKLYILNPKSEILNTLPPPFSLDFNYTFLLESVKNIVNSGEGNFLLSFLVWTTLSGFLISKSFNSGSKFCLWGMKWNLQFPVGVES